MPVRNAGRFIAEAIGSALAQAGCVGEVIVIDDGSTDDTVAVVRSFDDARVKLAVNPGTGVSAARNHGVAQASGTWIVFLDADDRLVAGAVPELLGRADPGTVAVYGDYDRMDEAGRRTGWRHLLRNRRAKPTGDILRAIVCGNFVQCGCAILRRDQILAVGGFDPQLALCEDWLLWCKLAACGPFTYVKGLHVSDYRIHPTSTMHRRARTFAEFQPVLDRIFGDRLIRTRLEPTEVDALRARAEASLRFYVMTEAARLGAWPLVLDGFLWAARRSPGRLPQLMVRLGASIAGV